MQHVFIKLCCIVASVCVNNAVSLAQSGQSETLVEDAMPLYQAAQSAKTVEAVRARKPELTARWQGLKIGEFETDREFQDRQRKAREQENADYARELQKWEDELKVAAGNMAKIRESQAWQPKLLGWQGHAAPAFSLYTVELPEQTLPYFSRRSMSFEGVSLAAHIAEKPYKGRSDRLVQLTVQGWTNCRIVCDDMETAKQFKESVAAGKVSLIVLGPTILAGWEEPILVKPASVERVLDKGVAAAGIGAALIAAFSGVELSPDQTFAMAQASETTKYNPAETRPGIRFQFTADPVALVPLRDSKPVNGVTIIPQDRRKCCMVFIVDDTAPEPVGALKPFDIILSIDGLSIVDAQQMMSAFEAARIGALVRIRYLCARDGKEYELLVQATEQPSFKPITAFIRN